MSAVPPVTSLVVLAPLPGVVRPLDDVPDDVFAQAMVGPGIAIDPPREGEIGVVAPVAGTVVKVHPHAVALETAPSGATSEDTTGPGTGSDAPAPSHGSGDAGSGPRSGRGRGVLVHLGIDTIKLDGEGFTVHVEPDQQVRAGELLISWRPSVATVARYPVITPVLALGAKAADLTLLVPGGETVDAGDELFRWA